MNALLCTFCATTGTDICSVPDSQEDFATKPMQAVEVENRGSDEEALHLSFEEAISDRISVLSLHAHTARLAFASTGALYDTAVEHALSTLATKDAELSKQNRLALLGTGWRRNIAYLCIALMLMLIGFDLMGLLILRLH